MSWSAPNSREGTETPRQSTRSSLLVVEIMCTGQLFLPAFLFSGPWLSAKFGQVRLVGLYNRSHWRFRLVMCGRKGRAGGTRVWQRVPRDIHVLHLYFMWKNGNLRSLRVQGKVGSRGIYVASPMSGVEGVWSAGVSESVIFVITSQQCGT